MILTCVIALFFFWFGSEIHRGNKKLYHFIAGNIFGDSDDNVEKHHKGLGIFYCCFGMFVLSILWWGPKLQTLLEHWP